MLQGEVRLVVGLSGRWGGGGVGEWLGLGGVRGKGVGWAWGGCDYG